MFDAQRTLVDLYIKIEGLPNYPINIHEREGQKVIKDFIRRLTEELSEAHEAMCYAFEKMDNNQNGQAVQHLRDHNIEIADAWHFLLELIIFMGYDQSLEKCFQKMPSFLHSMIGDNHLQTILSLGGYYNFQEGLTTKSSGSFNIVQPGQLEPELMNLGNKRVSREILNTQSSMLWNLVCNLHLLANELKNREWTQSEKTVNLIRVEEILGESLVLWGRYLAYGEFTQIGIHAHYMEKNAENLKRINQGY